MNIVVVIVTKDRPDDLQRCLESIKQQTIPSKCIVVDGSTTARTIAEQFQCDYYRSDPGITKQRNVARNHIPDDTDIVIYCDDDTVWSANVLGLVQKNFEDQNVVGLTGNFSNEPIVGLFKKIIGTLSGTYTTKPYSITSGIFNIINPVVKHETVQWLPGAFMCYRWSAVKAIAFDEWFSGYGLGEDFDFSYRVGSQGKLLADPDLKIIHLHSAKNRDWQKFGTMRIVNRNYLRKKFWPKSTARWLGMSWSNSWLMLANGLRGVYAKRYRDEFLGEIKAIFI